MPWRRNLLTTVITAMLCVPCAGQGTDTRPELFEQVLGDRPVQDATRLWQRLIKSDFHISSTDNKRRGYFESAGSAVDQSGRSSAFYWQLDDNGTRRVRYTPGTEPDPGMVLLDDQLFLLEASQRWERRTVKQWSLILDSTHFLNFAADASPLSQSHIEVDLGGYLNGVQASPVASCAWDASTSTLRVTKSSGGEWFIRFRTPSDQQRFGTLLSELDLRAARRAGYMNHRCFIVGQQSSLRLNVGSVDELSSALDARNGSKLSPIVKVLQVSGPEDRKAALLLSQYLNRLKCDDPRPTKDANSVSRFQEMLYGYQAAYQDEVVPGIRGEQEYAFIVEFVEGLIEELEIAHLSIESAIATDGGPVDDPCLLWLGLERAITPRMAGLLYGDLCAGILNWESAPMDSRIALCTAVSEFGAPIWAASEPAFKGNGSLFLTAIKHARWGWPPAEEEISECVEVLKNEASTQASHLAAVDSLVRWGRFDLVPEEVLRKWLSTRCSGSDATRRSTLKCLSRSVKGRGYLFEELQNDRLRRDAAAEAVALMRSHASSSLKLERFDFMSEEECRDILTKWK